MTDASETYKLVQEFALLTDHTFCYLHKCAEPITCAFHQHHDMLNFDDVKTCYCEKRGIKSCKSVDALSYNDKGILFLIEIKGWELYEKHYNPKTEQEVKAKVKKYKLVTKLSDSLEICKDVLSETWTEVVLPIVYFVVSDVKRKAVEELAAALSVLAETSSDFSEVYGKEIDAQLSGIHDIDCGYVADCRQIDKEINSWCKARKIKLV